MNLTIKRDVIDPKYYDSITKIATVKDLMESEFKGGDAFFLPYRHTVENGKDTFTLNPDDAVIVNPWLGFENGDETIKLRDAIEKETGRKIPTRNDIESYNLAEYGVAENTKIIGAGSFVWVKQEGKEDSIYLQNRTDKKATTTTVSGLVSDSVIETIWRETVEEMGLCLVDKEKGNNLVVAPVKILMENPIVSPNAVISMVNTKEEQFDVIQSLLPEEVKNHKLAIATTVEMGFREGAKEIVVKDYNGKQEIVNGFAFNAEKNNFNIMNEITLTIPKHLDIVTVDPENLGRPTAMMTKTQFDKCITDPNELKTTFPTNVKGWSSFVKAYGEELMARENANNNSQPKVKITRTPN